MFCYSAFAFTIGSELELPELPAGEGEPDVSIRFGREPAIRRRATTEEEFASTEGVGDFVIRDGKEILIYPRDGVNSALFRVVLLGKIMAFLLTQRGWLPLHASGVALGPDGVLFLGLSGSGKSTTAAAFHWRGHKVIADDVGAVKVVAGNCIVQPAWPRLRLTEDARAFFDGPVPDALNKTPVAEFQFDKHSLDLGGGHLRKSFTLKRIYILDYGQRLAIEAIPRSDSAVLLETHSFIKRWRVQRKVQELHFQRCAGVAKSMIIHKLTRPRSLESLADLVSLVEKHTASND